MRPAPGPRSRLHSGCVIGATTARLRSTITISPPLATLSRISRASRANSVAPTVAALAGKSPEIRNSMHYTQSANVKISAFQPRKCPESFRNCVTVRIMRRMQSRARAPGGKTRPARFLENVARFSDRASRDARRRADCGGVGGGRRRPRMRNFS